MSQSHHTPLTKSLSVESIVRYRQKFNQVSCDGQLEKKNVRKLLNILSVDNVIGYKVRDWLNDFPGDSINLDQFEKLLDKIGEGGPSWRDKMEPLAGPNNLVVIPGHEPEDSHHSYIEEEKVGFLNWINQRLANDPILTSNRNYFTKYVPIPEEGDALFTSLKDGILLSKLMNDSVPGTVDERALNYPKTRPLNFFMMLENQNVVLNSCKAIGCRIVNITPEFMADGVKHLQLSVLWQVIRAGLMHNITLKKHPGLKKLLLEGETLAKFVSRSPEEILVRWVNYQLSRVCEGKRIKNFYKDICDGVAYTYLLTAIAPSETDLLPLRETSLEDRMELILEYAENLGVRHFVTAKDIIKGSPKLNTAFVAQLFNMYPALDSCDQEDQIDDFDDEAEVYIEETREEKSFRHWLNSFNFNPYVSYLYEDLRDGHLLLQVFDAIKPCLVDWNRVNVPPFEDRLHVFKSVENCNYCIELGKQLKFKLIGIAGLNIYEGNKLLLSLLWQMMRYHTLSLMRDGEKEIGEEEVVSWCNKKLEEDKVKKGRAKFSNFKDASLRNSRAVLDLIDAIQPGSIGYDMVDPRECEESWLENARYSLTMARKIGATVFALPEDIVEGNPKMMMLIFARLMAVGNVV